VPSECHRYYLHYLHLCGTVLSYRVPVMAIDVLVLSETNIIIDCIVTNKC